MRGGRRLYVVFIAAGVFAEFGVRPALVMGDAAETARHLDRPRKF